MCYRISDMEFCRIDKNTTYSFSTFKDIQAARLKEVTLHRADPCNSFLVVIISFSLLLGVLWRDKLRNEIGGRTGQQTTDSILTERRLCWFGHVLWMGHQRPAQQALYWEVHGYKRDQADQEQIAEAERRNKERFREDGTYLRRSWISSCQQTRMASGCCPMHTPGCGMNHGQRQRLLTTHLCFCVSACKTPIWAIRRGSLLADHA